MIRNHAVSEQLECRQQMEYMTAQADTMASSVGQRLLDWPKGLLQLLSYANEKKLYLGRVACAKKYQFAALLLKQNLPEAKEE